MSAGVGNWAGWQRLRGSLALALCALAAAAVAAAAVLSGSERGASAGELRMTASSGGKMALTSSKPDEWILRAGRISPGQTVRGRVAMGVRGGDARLWLTPAGLESGVGPNGGVLASVLVVTVERPWAIQEQNRSPVYHGSLAQMPRLNLGAVPDAATRRYRITAAFPDGGQPPSPTTGDNIYQGAFAGVDFVWTAQGT